MAAVPLLSPRPHTSSAYEKELRTLREQVTLMAGRVELMLARAMQALADRDRDLAEKTIAEDARVNRAELDNDELCMRILARRQPLASDLRFITLTLKMVTDIERIGDLAVNIAERAIDLARAPMAIVLHDGLARMGVIVQSMVSDAIDAFVNADVDTARAVIASDDEIDALYDEVFADLLSNMHGARDPGGLHATIHVMSVAKWLERVGDHAVNIAEMVVFLVDGTDVRHVGKLGDGGG